MLKPSLGNKNTGLIKVLLADDHSIVREGLRALLESEKDIEVIGEAETGRDVLILAVKLKPDIILMDIAMPLLNGMEATRQLKTLAPNSKVLVLSAHSDAAYVEKMLGLGIRGYLIKQNSFKILATAIREVNMGNMYFSPTIATHFQNQDWRTGAGRRCRPCVAYRARLAGSGHLDGRCQPGVGREHRAPLPASAD